VCKSNIFVCKSLLLIYSTVIILLEYRRLIPILLGQYVLSEPDFDKTFFKDMTSTSSYFGPNFNIAEYYVF